jgi:ferric-chelate reductase [NAD(P)H]
MNYGMYIISSRNNDYSKINAFLGNTCFQLTASPINIAVSINKENLTGDFIEKSNVFTISIITESADMKFIGHFGFRNGRDFDKFSPEIYKYKLGDNGSPIILDNTNAYIEVNVKNKIDVGTHQLFIGEVSESDILNDEISMTYKFYHEVLKGKTPKKAATYI